MVESLVQWTLLNNPEYLSNALNFNFSKIIGQEITTDYGRIDFALLNSQNEALIVELETRLDSQTKRDYCFSQTLNYKNINFADKTSYCILLASETTPDNYTKVQKFCIENNVQIKTYSLEDAKELYASTIKRLSLNVGLALPNPRNYTICYLRWLNKIMKPFADTDKVVLTENEILTPFHTATNSITNFQCYRRIALDFELIQQVNNSYELTENGIIFVNNMNPFISSSSNVSSIELTNEQKRLLLKVLTNGNWENKVHKVNIYWFMRFIEVTNGNWIPKTNDIEQSKLEIAKGLFNVSYTGRTMREFLTWCCNYCVELGLVEIIKTNTAYNQVILTPLGVEINNIFSLDLSLKRHRMNLSFKFLE